MRKTANSTLEGIDYDFKVFNDPNKMREFIFKKNKINNKARMVAGYCWNWISRKDPQMYDISIPEYNFRAQWNLNKHGSLWIEHEESVTEIGCIHTCQGLDIDYIGIIIGKDLIARNGKIITQPEQRAQTDASLVGYKKMKAKDPLQAKKEAGKIIKNTYYALMTRGMKGCCIYCVDKETEDYFKSKVA